MFKRKTLFIIGAGASKEAGLPCGDELALKINGKLDIKIEGGSHIGNGDRSMFDAFLDSEGRRRESGTYVRTAWLIRDGIHLTDSIDNFLNLHRDNEYAISLAKTTIVKCILEAEKESMLWFDDSNLDKSIDFRSLHATWFAKFIKALGKDVRRDMATTLFDNVSFIVFNYDRCLEHFLHHAVRRLYGFGYEQAASICDEVEINHPFGMVAPLRIESGSGVLFGDVRAHSVNLAANIKTFTEQTLDGDMLGKIREQMLSAECIIFLGLAFHDPVMLMLKSDAEMKPIQLFSTG